MTRPKLLDLFSGAGGAGQGYRDAGFDVVGVDKEPQVHFPFLFVQADALEYLAAHGSEYDAIHASPPCQCYTRAQRLQKNHHPDLIALVREALITSGKPYIIENVPGSPLLSPVLLCGLSFGLGVYRHRLFESNVPTTAPPHLCHTAKTAKMGRPPKPGEMMHVVGNYSGAEQARRAMGIDWMPRDSLREAVPPAYTRFLGRQLKDYL